VTIMTDRDDGKMFDPHGPGLVYMLIADDIAGQIGRGDLRPDQRLPGEADLAAHYVVARMTVRRAIRELRERGLVKVVSGKGTFVVPEDQRP